MKTKDKDSAKEKTDALAGTVAGEIWGEIKDKTIEMFALPNQQVHMHVKTVLVDPSRLFLVLNSSAVLPSLEAAVGNKYTVELVDKFAVVSRVPAPLTAK